MPRRTLARRFEPRVWVFESTLGVESRHVGQELQDYLLQSIDERRGRLKALQVKIVTSEANLQHTPSSLPDRERLAIRCMPARDVFHIGALYERFLPSLDATGPSSPRPEEMTEDDEPRRVLGCAPPQPSGNAMIGREHRRNPH